MNKIDEMDIKAEQKIGPVWNVFRFMINAVIISTIGMLLAYACG